MQNASTRQWIWDQGGATRLNEGAPLIPDPCGYRHNGKQKLYLRVLCCATEIWDQRELIGIRSRQRLTLVLTHGYSRRPEVTPLVSHFPSPIKNSSLDILHQLHQEPAGIAGGSSGGLIFFCLKKFSSIFFITFLALLLFAGCTIQFNCFAY